MTPLEDFLKLAEECIDIWGGTAQKHMAIEEMSELTKEICKDFRGDDPDIRAKLLDEIVDVSLMMLELRVLYNFTQDEFLTKAEQKIDRVRASLERTKENIKKRIAYEADNRF